MEKLSAFKIGLAGILGALGAFLGLSGVLFVVLFVLMAIDYASGWIAAAINGEWKSKTARAGVVHKLGMIFAVAVSGLLDLCLMMLCESIPELSIVWPCALFTLVCAWYIFTEIGSILENVALMGAPVPTWLLSILDVGKKILDKKGEPARDE